MLAPLEGAFVAPLSFAAEGLDCTVAGACGCAGCSVLSGVAFCVSWALFGACCAPDCVGAGADESGCVWTQPNSTRSAGRPAVNL